MGEIIFSFFVGGWMVLTGVFMNYWLLREEKNSRQEESAKGGN